MTTYAQYYEKSLYPLQDRILKIVNDLSGPFYLTGGTALSRGYLKHRYSDDLDFFANDIPDFTDQTIRIIDKINRTPGLSIDPSTRFSSDTYQRLAVQDESGTRLKIDFVNDVPFRVGKPHVKNVLGMVDSLANILTNKVSAIVGRTETKDAVDLWQICLRKEFSWKKCIDLALKKDAGTDTWLMTESLMSIDEEAFNSIRWIHPMNYSLYRDDIREMCSDIMEERDNSLHQLALKRSACLAQAEEKDVNPGKSSNRSSGFGPSL